MDKTVVTIGDQRYVLVPEWVWDEIIGATSAAEVMMPAAQPQVQSQWPPTMLTRQVPAPIVSVMENTTELIFEDAPPSVNIKTRPPGSTPFTSWLLALRDYQGKTVKYPEPVNPGVSFQVNRGKYAGIEDGEFKAVARAVDAQGTMADKSVNTEGKKQKKVWIYVTYLGPPWSSLRRNMAHRWWCVSARSPVSR